MLSSDKLEPSPSLFLFFFDFLGLPGSDRLLFLPFFSSSAWAPLPGVSALDFFWAFLGLVGAGES